MALILGELAAILTADNTRLRRGLSDAERDVRRSGRQMEQDTSAASQAMATALAAGGRDGGGEFTREASTRLRDERGRFLAIGRSAGEALGDGITRGADGRLRDSRGRFVRTGRQLGDAAGQAAAGGLDSLRQALGNAGTAATNILSNVWNLVPALGALAAGATVATPALYAVGGALASLPALAAGGGAAVGTLALGFMGLADAFGQTATAGGAAVDKAWQVAQAQRALANAQREVVDAQEAVTRARADEVERLDDLNRSLREARLNEQEAALDQQDAAQRLAEAQNAVAIAEQKLNQARASGDVGEVRRATQELLDAQQQQPEVIRRAELAYERAKLATDNAKDSTDDLVKEQRRAAQVGVDGSDQVRAALDRQRQAVQAVADAQHALAEAQKPAGGGGGAGQELMALAPSAQNLVNVIKSLKPAFESLRLDVQQRLFAGMGGEIRALAGAWLPTLHRQLGGFADTFNGLFRLFSRSARKPEFIANIATAMEGVRGLIDKVGKALAGPGVDAFGKLAAAAGPVLTVIGDKLAGAVTSFAAWIDKADRSGQLTSFFETAARYLGDIWDLGRDVGGLLAEFFSMWSDSNNGAAAGDLFDTLRAGIRDLREWLADPKNRQQLRDFIDGFVAFGAAAMDVIGWLVTTGIPGVWGAISWLIDGIDSVTAKAGAAKDWIVGRWDALLGWLSGLPRRVSRATAGMFDGLKNAFRAAVNWMIARWNNFSLTLGGGSVLGVGIPSVTLSTPNIPFLARGGHITQAGTAVVGELGPEMLHLPAGATVEPLSGRAAPAAVAQRVDVRGEILIRGDGILSGLREKIAIRGGNVQAVLGSNT